MAGEMARPGYMVHPRAEVLWLCPANKPILSPAGTVLAHARFILTHWDPVRSVWVTLAMLRLFLLQSDAATTRCCYLQPR